VPWISIDWDGWVFGGVETAARSTASLATTPSEGIEVFARVMNAAPMSRTIVSTADLQRRIDRWVTPSAVEDESRSHELRIEVKHARETRTAYVAPRNDTERAMAAIWADLLGIEHVGVDDDFFALGGHSLLGTRVMSRVRENFGVDLSLSALFATPNVSGLSARVDKRRTEQVRGGKVAKTLLRMQSLSSGDRQRLLQKARETRRVAE